ncbi:hypothetical protein V2O64_23800 [Verrucomicrobiaceae bacterium 227]
MNFSRSLPVLCASLLVAGAQDDLTLLDNNLSKEEEHEKNTDVRDRIPAGAVLTDFSVPRFSEDRKRLSLLTAKEMEVESSEVLNGTELKLRMFDDEENICTTATIAKANYYLKEEQLIGSGDIIVREKNDEFYAHGQGGIFSFNTGQALMLGPAQTMFVIPDKKTAQMNLKSTLPFAALIQLLAAVPPPELSAEELANFERTVAPRMIPEFRGPELMEKADAKNKGVERRLAEYLTSVKKYDLLLQVAAQPAAEEADPLKELFEENPNRIFITASKGIYFDGTSFELVYLGDVELKGQGVTLSCNQDLKVIFDPPPADKDAKPDDAKDNPVKGFGGVGELRQFTASGNLRISGEKDGETFHLGGDRAIYDKAKNQIIIRGDTLAFKMGENATRSQNKNTYAVINIDANNEIKNIQFSKGWETVLTVPQKAKKN